MISPIGWVSVIIPTIILILSPIFDGGIAHAQGRPAARVSYCDFGSGSPNSSIEPGGGGDIIVFGSAEPVVPPIARDSGSLLSESNGYYQFVFDSSSPVTLENHDRAFFHDMNPRRLSLNRIGDHLVFCDARNRYELVIERHYCRAKEIVSSDVPNNEIEELIFTPVGEIWLADVLYEALNLPENYPWSRSSISDYNARPSWNVRKFSEVLPNWSGATTTCSAP